MGSPSSFVSLSFFFIISIWLIANSAIAKLEEDDVVVERFRDYLRIATVHPEPDYQPPARFLLQQAHDIGLEAQQLELVPKKFLVLLSWRGSDPSLPSVLLNSHTDVVPAEPAKWDYPPFSAAMDPSGNIFARGSQDMKCVGMQYLEAVRRLKANGFRPHRSLHISFVPDEEIGGENGAKAFVKSKEFNSLNVGVVLDEGLASPDPHYRVFNGERSPWWLIIKSKGAPGHGSKLFDNSALENLLKSLEAISRYRDGQFNLVKAGMKAEGEVTSINPVFLKAGTPTPTDCSSGACERNWSSYSLIHTKIRNRLKTTQLEKLVYCRANLRLLRKLKTLAGPMQGFVMNMQPSEAEAGFDIRVSPFADPDALENRIEEEWAPASRNMTFEFKQKEPLRNKLGGAFVTVANSSNPWWVILEEAVTKAGGVLGKPEIFPAATDCRYIRDYGIPAFGFSPMANTPILLHDHNEFLNKWEYLKGIEIYETIIESLTTAVLSHEVKDKKLHIEL